jgi:hypothetical protein
VVVLDVVVLLVVELVLVVDGLDGLLFMLGPEGGSDPAVAEPGGRATAAAIGDSARNKDGKKKNPVCTCRVSTHTSQKTSKKRRIVAHLKI